VAGVISMFGEPTKQIQRSAGRQMNTLSRVEPQEMARKAKIDLELGPVYAFQGPTLHRGGAVRAIHGTSPDGVYSMVSIPDRRLKEILPTDPLARDSRRGRGPGVRTNEKAVDPKSSGSTADCADELGAYAEQTI
jgi:hypothetical protein